MSKIPYKPHHFILAAGFLLLFTTPARAISLRSSDFRIDLGIVNLGSQSKPGGQTKSGSAITQTSRGQFDSVGYRIRSGFQFLSSTIPFSFSLDKPAINFNQPLPGTFYTDTNHLSVTSGDSYGYQVLVIENQPLTAKGGETIPDSTCDPASACTVSYAAPWTSTLATGFGYNLTGDHIETDTFVDSTYFRPFPANSLGGNPQIIMSSSSRQSTARATITYRLNLSPNQPAGAYRNIIQYLTIPAY